VFCAIVVASWDAWGVLMARGCWIGWSKVCLWVEWRVFGDGGVGLRNGWALCTGILQVMTRRVGYALTDDVLYSAHVLFGWTGT
jgi:hypothetical protein